VDRQDDHVRAVNDAWLPGRVVALTRWVDEGRRLTQTGRLTLADARELAALLETGDEIDPVVGRRVFRTRSSEDLRGLNLVLAWARTAGLLRVERGRLVPVKKNAGLLDRPLELWAALFDGFDGLGEAICGHRYVQSLLGADFPLGVSLLFHEFALGGGSVSFDEVCERIWTVLSRQFRLDHLTEEQLTRLRKVTDWDMRATVDQLRNLGALTVEEPTVALTPLCDWGLTRPYGIAKAGEKVATLTVTLAEVEPPVWRRVVVPAAMRLDRLHTVVAGAVGWQDYHLHMFTKDGVHYGAPDLDDMLELRDERAVKLSDLLAAVGDTMRYEYDFGDGWEHEIRLDELAAAAPEGSYPRCAAGERACPPEDCGGPGGYEDLIAVLGDPGHEEHEHMRNWLGLAAGVRFDPEWFDLDEANARLLLAMRRRTR
jgi:hypothetical protein